MMGHVMRVVRVAAVAALAVLAAAVAPADGQLRYSTGQNVGPVFEGWMRQADGSTSFVFGYLNRNHEQLLDVPIGADNRCEPGPIDCGQPTHFLTRRHRFVFMVPVPKGWDPKAIFRWTVTSNGKTDFAKAWLHPEMEISYAVMSENNGGGILDEGNTPPKILDGSGKQTATVGRPVTLQVRADDDGLPARKEVQRPSTTRPEQQQRTPEQIAAAAAAAEARKPGVRVRWLKYRGPGTISFTPPSVPPVHGKPLDATTQATFTVPGTYVVRATASDGQLETHYDATVVVQ